MDNTPSDLAERAIDRAHPAAFSADFDFGETLTEMCDTCGYSPIHFQYPDRNREALAIELNAVETEGNEKAGAK